MDAKELLTDVKNTLDFFNDSIKEVSLDIINNKISEYPVFIAHEDRINLGEFLFDKEEFDMNWHISVTTLEQLVELDIVKNERQGDFKKVYKPPTTHICLLLISEKGANFIFKPFGKHNERNQE